MAARDVASVISERLKNPHLLAELVKMAVTQSSASQSKFLKALEAAAIAVRDSLEANGLIHRITKNHKSLWQSVKGKPICFVDGGMANLSSLGTEPVAVRVGSFTVVPGETSDTRESFRPEKQLVAELFDAASDEAVYDDIFEDPSKLRDVARISLEASAALQAVTRAPKPEFVFMHGALVNPVSAYADSKFPAFSKKGLRILSAPRSGKWAGRESDFVVVYLELLEALKQSGVNIIAVVERASFSSLVTRTWLTRFKDDEGGPGAALLEQSKRVLEEFRISDSVLFNAILAEGEYLEPVEVDRNTLSKTPDHSRDIIKTYPKPFVTYLAVGSSAQPLRVEFFGAPAAGYGECMKLVYHCCCLMPNYAFPAGLDIVDKFAKVPNWMNRPIHSSMAVQMMKRAMDTGNAQIIAAAKQMLCGTKRDWLLRPTFNR
jgi:hypothetical protein